MTFSGRWLTETAFAITRHSRGLNVPPVGTPGRDAALVTKSFVFMGEGSDAGGSAARRQLGRQDVPVFRQEDRHDRVRFKCRRQQCTVTYMIGGKQYLVVAVSGRQHPGELLALSLPD